MEAERSLIAKCAHAGQVDRLITDGVRSEQFVDPELVEIFVWMTEHFRKYKAAPSFASVKEAFPAHNFEIVTDTLDYVRDRFFDDHKRRMATNAIRDLATHIDEKGTDDIEAVFMEVARRMVQEVPSPAVAKFSEMSKRIEEYDRRLKEGTVKGLMMGIPAFDHLTLGIQPHEYISVVGWQGTGKSTLVQWILYNAWLQKKRGLYISLEMECEALMRKWDTMAVNFQYHALKAMELDPESRSRWEAMAERAATAEGDIIALDDVTACSVDTVYARTAKWSPDIVVVDYITLMETGRSVSQSMWEKVTYLTQALKQQARTLKIPLIGVAQTNINSAQEGAALDNISYSRSIGQDSDLVLGLNQTENMRAEKQMQVRLLKNRDGAIRNTDLFWMMETMEFGPWDELSPFTKKPGAAEET